MRLCVDYLIPLKGLFVHRKFIVGSTPTNPINLKEGVKAPLGYLPACDAVTQSPVSQVSFKQGTQDSKPCALEVLMLGGTLGFEVRSDKAAWE